MLNSIRHHLKEREALQKNNEIESYSDKIDDSYETDILGLNIYRFITVTLLLAARCRQASVRLSRYKTLYIIKSRRWLDEDGQRIAIATSIPTNQNEDVKRADHLRDIKRDQIGGGGDLWMLLMSEEDLDRNKNEAGTRRKKRTLISS